MTSRTEWKTVVTIHNPERAQFWQEAIGATTLPVVSFVPSIASLPGYDRAQVYMLDLRVISEEMKAAIIKGIAQKFDLDPAFVASNINEVGVPILADDCSIVSTDQGLIMSVMGDDQPDPGMPLEYGDKICSTCGAYMEWEDCWNGCNDGYFDMFDEGPLWYDEDDTEVCDACHGRGGYWVCSNIGAHQKQEQLNAS